MTGRLKGRKSQRGGGGESLIKVGTDVQRLKNLARQISLTKKLMPGQKCP